MKDKEEIVFIYSQSWWEMISPPLFVILIFCIALVFAPTGSNGIFMIVGLFMFVASLIPALFWKIVVTEVSISGPSASDKFARVKFPLGSLRSKKFY